MKCNNIIIIIIIMSLVSTYKTKNSRVQTLQHQW